MTIRRVAILVVAFAAGLIVADRMMAGRSLADDGAPATTRATSRPTIPADARAILDRVTAAYARRPIEVAGTFDQHFDIAGITRDQTTKLAGVARDATTYRHDLAGSVLVVADGKQATVYDVRAKRYRTEAPADASAQARAIVALQNPALAVAIEGDAAVALVPDAAINVRRLSQSADESLDGIGLTVDGTKVEIRVRADGTIDRVTYDFADVLIAGGAADVKRATALIRYEKTGVPDAAANADAQFAFVAPPDARDVTSAAGDDAKAIEALKSGPAPAFTLKALDGGEVKLESERGHVVVLDFWATWCGPCRVSLPHLATTAQKFAARGVRTYAINAEEDVATVQAFWATANLTGVRALLDADGAVGRSYGVNGIPHTVVVDAKGEIREVIVGFNPEVGPEKLESAIGAALDAR